MLEMPEEGEGEVGEGYVGLDPAGDPVIYRAHGEVVLVHPEGFFDAPQAPVMGEDVLRFRGAFRWQIGDDSVKAVPPAVELLSNLVYGSSGGIPV